MNARIALKLHRIGLIRRPAAAVPAAPGSIRAAHITLHHNAAIATDSHAPRVLCDRSLNGWQPISRTQYTGVIR